METFGSHLRKLRKHRKMTQKSLARSMKVSIAYIHQLETGKSPPPNIQRCRQVARALKVDFNELWRLACAERLEKSLNLDQIAKNEFKPMVLSSSEIKLVEILRALDNDTRLKFLALLRDLILNHPNENMLILIADFLEGSGKQR